MKKINIYSNIKNIIESARNNVVRTVNSEMVQAYWNIGRIIVEEEQKGKQRANYGEYLIKELSEKLTKDYGKGFDKSNLWHMRLFYLRFPICDALRHESTKTEKVDALRRESIQTRINSKNSIPLNSSNRNPIVNAVRSELTWTHYRLLIRVEREDSRNFYIKECINNKWSTRELDRQINSLLFERLVLSKNKEKVKELSLKGQIIENPIDIIKDPYILEFLNIKENHSEKDFEKALIDKLQNFLLELGKGFTFVSRQKRITVDNEHYYIDLVFYNYILKCFFLIDLKIGKLTPQDIGQIDFYVRYFEKEIKTKEDNPTIGLVLCSDKSKVMAKYTLLNKNKNVFASKYRLYLPTEEEIEKEIKRIL